MGIYLLLLAGAVLAAIVLGATVAWVIRVVRRLSLAAFELRCECDAEPGGTVQVEARVVPRAGRSVCVEATLACTMFDHRAHLLYSRTQPMEPRGEQHFAASLTVPEGALRTGRLGDELAFLFSEETRRLLVSWSVQVTVRSTGGRRRVLARAARPLEIAAGRDLSTEPAAFDHLVVGAFTDLKDDLLFNWMVKVAAADGGVGPLERELLHEVLRGAHGVQDAAAADARIAEELDREVGFDLGLLGRHVSTATRMGFCRLLYAVAWREGGLEQGEKALLTERLCGLGLGRDEMREVEREVLLDIAKRALA
jgi:hypothetical protein